MRVLNIGSMNLDYVYKMDHIVLSGETQESHSLNLYLGGKGFNQTTALFKAGADVYHAGLISKDGEKFLEVCDEYRISKDYIKVIDGNTGHAIIQIDKKGENCILLYGGANQKFTEEYIDNVLKDFEKGDLLLLQNEINLLPYIVEKAHKKGMTIALNPSPFNEKLLEADLSKIDIFILNEVEGKQITGFSDVNEILKHMVIKFPEAQIVLTLGEKGSIYKYKDTIINQPSFKVNVVDTTAAGDTFTGYFLAGLIEKINVNEVLNISAKASSIAVTKHGAIPSIPSKEEVIRELEK